MSFDLASRLAEAAIPTHAHTERRRVPTSDEDRAATSVARAIFPVRFVDFETKERVCADAARARAIVLRPRADGPGMLAHGIDGDLESALALRGALPSGLPDDASLEERLVDQLTRATCVPVRGLCLALPPLGACVEDDGVLADVDARYLGAWLRAIETRTLPISLLFDASDEAILARVPRSLADVVADLKTALAPETVDQEPAAARPTDDVARRTGVVVEPSDDDEDTSYFADDDGLDIPDLLRVAEGASDVGGSEDAEPAPVVEDLHAAPTDAREAESPSPARGSEIHVEAHVSVVAREAHELGEAHVAETPEPIVVEGRDASVRTSAPRPREEQRRPTKSLAAAMSETLRPPSLEPVHVAPIETKEEAQAARLVTAAEWRTHALELDAARGPKPVSTIERLFAKEYVPLLGALMRDEVDHSVSSIIEQWAQAFAQSYTDAYPALKVTGRRPTMVLDAFDVASRIARLSSARSVKLVLVDSMSFDLSERVAERMKAVLDKRAVLVERTTMWSALPTTTPTQMALLGRGPEGLRDTAPVSSSEPDITRGRNISTLRRERVGSRELIKLDLVEARLKSPGVAYDERLDALADEVCDVLVKMMETLPPRTLVYVFGDHGFVLGHGSNGWATGAATQGGATPEEVLVAGHAWLVDAMQ